jgi:quercetin dioxygenase-like cupin family protein
MSSKERNHDPRESRSPGHSIEWAREMASLHALGVLSAGEARDFEAHLAAGCPICAGEMAAFQDVLGEVSKASASAIVPPPELKSRLREKISPPVVKSPPEVQVWKKWGERRSGASAEAARSLHVVRAGEAGFEPTASPGVFAKPLHVDPDRHYVTMLVRMEPGSSYPSHVHAGAEECYVLSGDLRVGEEVLHGGDYQCAEVGSHHGVQSTERGCLLLIISSQDDELS